MPIVPNSFCSCRITTPSLSFKAVLSALQAWFDTGPAEEYHEGPVSLAEHLGWLATDPIDRALIEEPDGYRFLNH